jgi:hypothetical protein
VLSAALLLALWAGTAAGDRTTAAALSGQARKAADEGDPAHAETLWKRAIAEDETYAPARLGVAEALLARGQAKAGLAELRAALEAAGTQPEATSAWAPDLARARKRLAELEAAEAGVRSKLSRHIEASLALAAKWSGKDPDLSRAVLNRVLRLEPGHGQALELMATLGEGTGRVVPLFNGRNGAGWVGFTSTFKVVDGAIEASLGAAGAGMFTEEMHTADYDFRAETRVLEHLGEPMMFAIILRRSASDMTMFGYAEQKFWLNDEVSGTRTTAFTVGTEGLDPAPDLKAWNRLEMRLRGGTVTCWLNGKQVGEGARRDPSVPVQLGFSLQQARVQFRAIEVRRL